MIKEEYPQYDLPAENDIDISFNPVILDEIENMSSFLLSNSLEIPLNAIPGIIDNCSTEISHKIEEHSNPFYKIKNHSFHIADDGLILIELLKSKAKRSFIVLEMAKLEIKEKGYEFNEVLEFFDMMERQGYLVKKPKNKYSVFKFTNKFQY